MISGIFLFSGVTLISAENQALIRVIFSDGFMTIFLAYRCKTDFGSPRALSSTGSQA
jgi:hypothetical protein